MNDIPLIALEGVTKEYHSGKMAVPALRGVSLSIRKGEFVALVGPSGSGKSTLLNLLGGLDHPTAGTITVDGKNIATLSDSAMAQYRQRTVGVIFQSFNLLPQCTALQNVLIPSLLAGTDNASMREKVKQLFARVGLAGKERNKPAELSGGEQQRVAVIRALINDPEFLLADEPTGNLDTKNGEIVMDLLKKLVRSNGKTLLMVTHDAHLAEQADRRLHLVDGKLEDRV